MNTEGDRTCALFYIQTKNKHKNTKKTIEKHGGEKKTIKKNKKQINGENNTIHTFFTNAMLEIQCHARESNNIHYYQTV